MPRGNPNCPPTYHDSIDHVLLDMLNVYPTSIDDDQEEITVENVLQAQFPVWGYALQNPTLWCYTSLVALASDADESPEITAMQRIVWSRQVHSTRGQLAFGNDMDNTHL